jgi:hypothetical protein
MVENGICLQKFPFLVEYVIILFRTSIKLEYLFRLI